MKDWFCDMLIVLWLASIIGTIFLLTRLRHVPKD